MRFSGPKIVWVIPGFLKDNWWSGNDTDCTDNEILSSIGNYFVVNVLFKSGSEPDDNGITLKQFMNDYKTKTENKTIAGSNFLLSSYDSVWVIARALNATIADLQNTGRLQMFRKSVDSVLIIFLLFLNCFHTFH